MSREAQREERGWLFLRQAASYANVSIDTIRKAVNAGELPAYLSPTVSPNGRRRVRICRADIDEYMRSQGRFEFGPMCD